jgi:hypothetical protein
MKAKHVIYSALILGGLAAGAGAASMMGHHSAGDQAYQDMHRKHHGGGNAHGGGMQDGSGHMHDEVDMPGLRGKDTTEGEVRDLKRIFIDHKGISRTVVNLPNGIRTTTEAVDEALRTAIIDHVTAMVTRLQEGRNPEVMIQSPTLDKLFAVYGDIETVIEPTDTGIAVVQTSDNPASVRLLQTHAAEVSDMAARGMAAVHERMRGGH